MERQFYLDLAKDGLCMPIGTDLVLHEHTDVDDILLDGVRLGQVIAEAAGRYQTKLAMPEMNLELEKAHMLRLLGIPEAEIPTYHFSDVPSDAMLAELTEQLAGPLSARMQAVADAVHYVATQTEYLPIGMAIGPFSLMTKLVADPIVPVAMAGSGLTAEDDDDIKRVEMALEMSIRVILHYLEQQIKFGAKAIVICEPAANVVYLSPNQIDAGSDIFDRYVMHYLQQIKALLNRYDVDLIFHDCGNLNDYIVTRFTELDPAILSLGSSRVLWEDARLVPKTTVLFGNLPSKKFYSDAEITNDDVAAMTREIMAHMREIGHPFIVGSECDVLSVPGCEAVIRAKVQTMISASCGCGCAHA